MGHADQDRSFRKKHRPFANATITFTENPLLADSCLFLLKRTVDMETKILVSKQNSLPRIKGIFTVCQIPLEISPFLSHAFSLLST